MRRHGLVSATIASLLAVTLAACGGSSSAGEQTPTQAQTETETVSEEAAAEVTTTNEAAVTPVQNTDPFVGRNISEFGFTVMTEGGEATNLATIANGKPLVLNVWATWCPYCVMEMPEFSKMTQEFADTVSFAFVDLTDGKEETKDKVHAYLAQSGLEGLPVYYDTTGGSVEPLEAYTIPETIVFDANGTIVVRIVGVMNSEAVRALLQSLIA